MGEGEHNCDACLKGCQICQMLEGRGGSEMSSAGQIGVHISEVEVGKEGHSCEVIGKEGHSCEVVGKLGHSCEVLREGGSQM